MNGALEERGVNEECFFRKFLPATARFARRTQQKVRLEATLQFLEEALFDVDFFAAGFRELFEGVALFVVE